MTQFLDVRGEWAQFRDLDYESWLEFLPFPDGEPPDYTFLDDFHQLYFDDSVEGSVPFINGEAVGLLVFRKSDPTEILFLDSFLPIDGPAILGLMLTRHLTDFNLSAGSLSFRLWNHQEMVITFLSGLK
ncbi:MAG: hypothetical protein J0L62_11085 [Bacteroidetes bacterium]|nr:hypothetical protein [Bacteroidota bacterium]